MKRVVVLLVFLLALAGVLPAQFARPLKPPVYMFRNNSPISIGVTGGGTVNDMVYSAVVNSQSRPVYTPVFGFAMEWNTLQRISVGVDLSYAQRGARKSNRSEFLINYSTSAFANVDYDISLTALELRFPITYWIGHHSAHRPYVFVAPRLGYWIKGDFKWVRSYENANYSPLVYESGLTDAMIAPVDVSVVAGVGYGARFVWGRTRFFVKLEMSYGVSLMSTFSWKEENAAGVVQGWGDLAHEQLGERYLQNLEARLILLLPLRLHLKDACVLR